MPASGNEETVVHALPPWQPAVAVFVSFVQFQVAALGVQAWVRRRASTCVPIGHAFDSVVERTALVTVAVCGMTTDVSKRRTARCDAVFTEMSVAVL